MTDLDKALLVHRFEKEEIPKGSMKLYSKHGISDLSLILKSCKLSEADFKLNTLHAENKRSISFRAVRFYSGCEAVFFLNFRSSNQIDEQLLLAKKLPPMSDLNVLNLEQDLMVIVYWPEN